MRLQLLLIIFALPGLAFAEPTMVHNSDPLLPARTIELQEQWRVGDEDEDIIFGLVIDSLADAEGNVYLLDNQLCRVEVFGPDGGHLRTISGPGEGPGEVHAPIAMEFMPDGSLGIMELFPSKFEMIDLEGEPCGSLTLVQEGDTQTGFTASISSQCRGDVLLVAGQRATPSDVGQDRTLTLARFVEDGHEVTRYREAKAVLSFSPPRFIENELLPPFFFANAVGPDGRVYTAAARDRYAIEVYQPDGTLELVIERDFENWQRDSRDKRRMNAMVDAWFQQFPGQIYRELDSIEPAITEIFVDEAGILWVQHSRSGRDQPDGIMLTYDTFDAEGRYLQQVSVACPGDPAYDGLKFLGDGRVLLIKGYVLARWASTGAQNVDFGEEEDTAVMEIVCCKIVEG